MSPNESLELLDQRERALRQELADMQRRYHIEAAPILDELARIAAVRPPAPVMVTIPAMADPEHIRRIVHGLD